MKRFIKASAAILFVAAFIPSICFGGTITGSTGTGQMKITVEPTIISAVVPTTIAATIKPNSEIIDYAGNGTTDTNDTFVAPRLTFTNNSNAPVEITLKSITPKAGSPSTIAQGTYTDEQWKNLNSAESMSRISFGFKTPVKNQWYEVVNEDSWVTPGNDYTFGSLNRKSSVNLELQSKYGLSFTSGQVFDYDVVYNLRLK